MNEISHALVTMDTGTSTVNAVIS